VNERLNFKKIYVTREDGIVVKDDNGKTIELDLLSSGEKQEIVLFYELIFETDGQLLLMIDEPEISLHIVWQRMFMRDLEKVAELGNLKVIVATHYPQIINNRWELHIDIEE
ncbi:AAA family ATPase, partial [Phascolarctobacterium succinatutens]|uniref:AAA family ATPase n=1 Tax=Phascolarctobacterium succinatutens TaxID=626940 RepID=UPI0023F99F63